MHSQPENAVHKGLIVSVIFWLQEALEELRKPYQKQNITMLAVIL